MATVEQTMMKVQRILTGPMKLQVGLSGDGYSVRFQDTSTVVNLKVHDWGKDAAGESRSLVVISSMILRDVKPSPGLFEWVAREGGSKWFGHIEVHNDGDSGNVMLIMSHTLLGDTLDEQELQSAMWTVLASADQWDDVLKEKFGGKRWSDQ